MRGHVYKRGQTWTYVVELGRDPMTGKRMQRSKGGYIKKKTAETAMTAMMTSVNSGEYITESNMTFKDYVEEWLKLYKATGKIKPSTMCLREFETTILLTHFKGVQLKEISFSTLDETQHGLQCCQKEEQ